MGVTVLSCDIFFWEGAGLAANSGLEGSQQGERLPPPPGTPVHLPTGGRSLRAGLSGFAGKEPQPAPWSVFQS